MLATTQDAEGLHALVRTRRMHYRLLPDFDLVDGVRARVGFRLQLLGAHEAGSHPSPGCERCTPLFHDLQRVAHALLSEDGPLVSCLEPFSRTLHDDPQLKTDDVSLTACLRPRGRLDDPDVERAVSALRQRLRDLGIGEGAWRDSAP